MKRNSTPRSVLAKWALTLSFFAFFCFSVMGQKAGSQVELGNLSEIKWKTSTDFNQTILQEVTRMDAPLASVGLQDADRALFLAYKQLTTYIQSDVQAGKTIGEMFLKRYEQVLAEAPKDPVMQHLIPGTLEGLLPGLVEVLMETPAVIGQ